MTDMIPARGRPKSTVPNRGSKHCCFGTCKSDTRSKSAPIDQRNIVFIPFPKPCAVYTDEQCNIITGGKNSPFELHKISNCAKCSKCALWIQLARRKDNRLSKLTDVTKNSYVCSLHFINGEGPTDTHPNPLPANAHSEGKNMNIRKPPRDRSTSNVPRQSKRKKELFPDPVPADSSEQDIKQMCAKRRPPNDCSFVIPPKRARCKDEEDTIASNSSPESNAATVFHPELLVKRVSLVQKEQSVQIDDVIRPEENLVVIQLEPFAENVSFSQPEHPVQNVSLSQPEQSVENVSHYLPDESIQNVSLRQPDESIQNVSFFHPVQPVESVSTSDVVTQTDTMATEDCACQTPIWTSLTNVAFAHALQNWAITPLKDGGVVMYRIDMSSKNHVLFEVKMTASLNCSISVLGKELPRDSELFKYSSQLNSLEEVDKMLNTLEKTKHCRGITEPKLIEAFRRIKTPALGVYNSDLNNVRSVKCHYISTGLRCFQCLKYSGTLYTTAKRASSKKEVDSKFCNNRFLSVPNLTEKMASMTKIIRTQKMKITSLDKTVKKLKTEKAQVLAAIRKSDLQQRLPSSENTEDSTEDGASFRSLFFQHQLRLTTKSKSQYRWHPTILRWCLFLRHKSPSTYRALRDSGIVQLPSKRTLCTFNRDVKAKLGSESENTTSQFPTVAEDERYFSWIFDEIKNSEQIPSDCEQNTDL